MVDKEIPEYAFVLRVPEHLAQQIDAACDDETLDQHLSFNISDPRSAQIKFDDTTYDASICDIPTNVEAFKTVDRAVYFKSVDISQMVLVHPNNEQDTPNATAVEQSTADPPTITSPSGERVNPCPKPPVVENTMRITSQLDDDAVPDFVRPGKRPNYQLRDGLTAPTRDILHNAWGQFHLPENFELKQDEELLLRLVYGDGEDVDLESVNLDAHQIAHLIGQQRNLLGVDDDPTDQLVREVLELKKHARKGRNSDTSRAKKELTEAGDSMV
ncbi:hypothetical protein P9112_007710 [Eukaryota sp. TZLM1-RC]